MFFNTGSVKVGAVHKLGKKNGEMQSVMDWVKRRAGPKGHARKVPVVIAGDQPWSFCDAVGLAHVDSKDHPTVPVVTCGSRGEWGWDPQKKKHRGDILCSSARVATAEWTKPPCVGDQLLSSHAITSVGLVVGN